MFWLPILPEGHNQCSEISFFRDKNFSEIRSFSEITIFDSYPPFERFHKECARMKLLPQTREVQALRWASKLLQSCSVPGMELLPPNTCTGTAKTFWESIEKKTILGTTSTPDFGPNHHGFCSFWTWKCPKVLSGFQDFQVSSTGKTYKPCWAEPTSADLNPDTQLGYWQGRGRHQGIKIYKTAYTVGWLIKSPITSLSETICSHCW